MSQKISSHRRQALHALLLDWYFKVRRDLPWRKTRDPYRIWLSEVMLQQTRVDTVIPYYDRFLHRFPTVHALAEAPLDDVLGLWSGLGYYRRARMMHQGAKQISSELEGTFPSDVESLRTIPGVGRYTAGAVASIAFGNPTPLVDGNVARVLARLFSVRADVRAGEGLEKIWAIAGDLVADDAGSWNQALMELGSLVCVPRQPRCGECPLHSECLARQRGIEESIPLLRPKSKPREWKRAALIVAQSGKIILGRRRASSVLGGMWEPPMVDQQEDLGDAFRELLSAPLSKMTLRGSLTHILTHRKMSVDVYAVKSIRSAGWRAAESADYQAFGSFSAGDLVAIPMSTLARKILTLIGREISDYVSSK